MTRKRWVALAAVGSALLLAAVAAVVVVRVLDEEPTGVAYAVTVAPPDAQRLLWTDWAGVRDEVGADLAADSDDAAVQDLLDLGYDADLTSTSALVESAVLMQRSLGFSPATLSWELFAQSESAASLTMRLGEGVTTDDVAEAIVAVGYVDPGEPDGVWTRDVDTSPVAADLTPELANIVLDEDSGTVLASDTADGARGALDALHAADSAALPEGVVGALGSPLSAALYTGDEACGALAMTNADASAQAEADQLVTRAGTVNPLTGFAIGELPDGEVRVTLGFDDEDEARTNADTRAVLAAGPAPGQGGEFGDRFTVDAVTADGPTVTMELAPVDGAPVLSDLSTGPVLFATC